jgi:hypothetical protein
MSNYANYTNFVSFRGPGFSRLSPISRRGWRAYRYMPSPAWGREDDNDYDDYTPHEPMYPTVENMTVRGTDGAGTGALAPRMSPLGHRQRHR